jgi:hypothetical protein
MRPDDEPELRKVIATVIKPWNVRNPDPRELSAGSLGLRKEGNHEDF